jgi:hypothetical protein
MPGVESEAHPQASNLLMTIRVYLDNGIVYHYKVDTAEAARDHSAAIVKDGYRHNDGNGEYVHYPSHRISKVKVVDGVIPTSYPDESSGT